MIGSGVHAGRELIAVHCHVVPPGFPLAPSTGGNPRWPCLRMTAPDAGVIEITGKAFRELDERSWTVTRQLADMDRATISMQVLSPMPELLSYWFDAAAGLTMARHANHALATMVAQAPTRLRALGMVPLQDVALATTELARLAADGFSGVEIGSNVNGLVLGEARFDEFFAEAAWLGLAVFVHALHPIGAERACMPRACITTVWSTTPTTSPTCSSTSRPARSSPGTDYPYAIEERDLRGFVARLPAAHHASVSHACARRFLAPFHRAGENPTLAFERDVELIQWLDALG